MMGAQPALTGVGGSPSRSAGAPVLGTSAHFPYLEATDSRVNLKNGVEKSPFSLVSADLSLWQDEPGKWRVRLRGQPVRTDMELSQGDTGEVRMEASLQSTAELREMPLKVQMEWRDAQLGQLSRLLLGSDAGWRGDVTADIDVQGTPESAQTRARLRATGVRREEFSPETPMDFDANCNFRYQHSQNALHQLGCDTAIGGGRLHLKAELPGSAGEPEATLEVQQVPLQAGLDMLRTVRSGFAPGISLEGSANGSLSYSELVAEQVGRAAKDARHRGHGRRSAGPAKGIDAAPTKLKGTITVDGGQLSGGELKEPLLLPKMVWTPAFVPGFAQGAEKSAPNAGLGTKFTIALGTSRTAQQAAAQAGDAKSGSGTAGASPEAISVRLGVGIQGFDAALTGTAGTARVRELAYAFGLPHLDAADGFSEGTADVDLKAAGPWIATSDVGALPQDGVGALAASPAIATSTIVPGASAVRKPRLVSAAAVTPVDLPGGESISGSVQLHHAQWKAAYLARPVEVSAGDDDVFRLPHDICLRLHLRKRQGCGQGSDSRLRSGPCGDQLPGRLPCRLRARYSVELWVARCRSGAGGACWDSAREIAVFSSDRPDALLGEAEMAGGCGQCPGGHSGDWRGHAAKAGGSPAVEGRRNLP